MRFAALCALFAYCAVGTAMAADAAPNPDHPGAVALARDNGTWVYQSFPAFLPLYVFDGDGLNQSNCDAVCAAVWPIIRAEAASKRAARRQAAVGLQGQARLHVLFG